MKINLFDIFEQIWYQGCKWGEGNPESPYYLSYLHPTYNPDTKFIQEYQNSLFSSNIHPNTLKNQFWWSQVSYFLKSIITCKVDENAENAENLIFQLFMNFTNNDGFPNVGDLGR